MQQVFDQFDKAHIPSSNNLPQKERMVGRRMYLPNARFEDLHHNVLGGKTNITLEEYGIEHPGDILVMDTNYLREELIYTTEMFNDARRNIAKQLPHFGRMPVCEYENGARRCGLPVRRIGNGGYLIAIAPP